MAPRKYVPVAIDPVSRTRGLHIALDPDTLARVRAFIDKVQAHYRPTIGTNRIVAQLLNDALDARLFFLHPGSGRGKDDNLTGF